MLVRLLSYIASVIGTRKYKPLLISCLALILSITGIAIVHQSLTGSREPTYSDISNKSSDQTTDSKQPSAESLHNLEKKQTKAHATEQPQPSEQSTNGVTSDLANKPTITKNPADKAFDITLNSSLVSISDSNPNAAITVSSNTIESKATTMLWSIGSLSEPTSVNKAPRVSIESSKDNSQNAVIRIRLEDSVPGEYLFTVTAKDTAGKFSASKSVTVVVN